MGLFFPCGKAFSCLRRTFTTNLRKMSGGYEVLKAQEADITKMLAATTHLGSDNSEVQMEQYIFKRRQDGVHIINLKKTWEKLMLAARAIAAIENPADVFVVSARPYGQRAVLKFARYIGAVPIAGRFTPGAFTNQIQAGFREPRLLVITDPRADHQPVTEASYANIPVVAFCNVDSPTKYIDLCIPCNNKGDKSIGLMCGSWPVRSCVSVESSPVSSPGKSCPICSSTEILRKPRRKSKPDNKSSRLNKWLLLKLMLARLKNPGEVMK